MRKLRQKLATQMAAGAAVVVAVCSDIQTCPAQTLPADALPTCTVPAVTFASWFQSGTPTVNGVVNPANSVAFSNVPNCPFYQWGKQMFLWLTSPSPSIYGGKGLIIDSPVFYDVSPPDGSGARTLLTHTPGFIRPFSVRAAQVGPLGLPVVFDTSGRMLEIQRAEGVVTSLRIPDATGNRVEITHAERSADGALVLRDASGSIVRPRNPVAPRNVLALPSTGSLLVREFIIDKIPIFIDPFGNVVEVEQGQSDGSVLELQGNSLIYYAIMVNDVYAYFLTGQKDGKIDPGVSNPQFPTTMADLTPSRALRPRTRRVSSTRPRLPSKSRVPGSRRPACRARTITSRSKHKFRPTTPPTRISGRRPERRPRRSPSSACMSWAAPWGTRK